jgi:hypothetical protein
MHEKVMRGWEKDYPEQSKAKEVIPGWQEKLIIFFH